MSLILERIFSATPVTTRHAIRKLKYYMMANMSSASYWNMAARISAKAAICTDCTDEQKFFESAKREANLARKKGLLEPDVRAIDIGCGIGRIERAIHSELGFILGVDVSEEMIKRARKKITASNVSFQTVDGRSLAGIESEQFDLCLSFVVLQHIPRAAVANYFLEVGRVLKLGGKFLFQLPLPFPGRGSEPPANHPFGMRYYAVDEVHGLLHAAGMILVERFDQEGTTPPDGSNENGTEYEFYLAQRTAQDTSS